MRSQRAASCTSGRIATLPDDRQGGEIDDIAIDNAALLGKLGAKLGDLTAHVRELDLSRLRITRQAARR